jgi:hypothetical protein
MFGPFSTVSVCSVGTRIEIAPHLDRWMMGDRFGTVVRFVRKSLYVDRFKRDTNPWHVCQPEFASGIRVKLDVSGKTVTIKADGIGRLI